MSRTEPVHDEDETDIWAEIAEDRDLLEQLAERDDLAFSRDAQKLLDKLEEEGY